MRCALVTGVQTCALPISRRGIPARSTRTGPARSSPILRCPMSDHSTQFEASGGGLVLRGAILLYRNEGPRNLRSYGSHRGDAAAFASMHAVEHDEEGRPTIAAGVPLSRAHLRQWADRQSTRLNSSP